MNTEKKITNLKSLIEKANIKWIVSIDDENISLNKVSESEIVRKIVANPDDFQEQFAEKGIDTSLFDMFSSLENDACVDLIKQKLIVEQEKKWSEFLQEQTKDSGSTIQKTLEKLKVENVIEDYQLIGTVDVAIDTYDDIIGQINPTRDKRILWLIDRDFSNVGGGPNTGFRFLDFIASKVSDVHICFILSANTEDVKPQELRIKFLEEQNLLEYNLLVSVLSKDEFQQLDEGGNDEIISKALMGLWGNYNYIVISKLAQYMEESARHAKEDLLRLPASTAKHIILTYPEKEGVPIPETIYRILNSLMVNRFNEYCRELTPMNQMLRDYKELEKDVELTEREKVLVFNLMHTEKYDANVNVLRKQIGFGDIFQTEDEKYYILLSQPCDIVYRKSRKLDQALLVRIREFEEEQEEQEGQGKPEEPEEQRQKPVKKHHLSEPLKYFIYQKEYVLDYRDFILVDFNILDLCVFNDDGEAKIRKNVLENSENLDTENIPFDSGRISEILSAVFSKVDSYITLEELRENINKITGIMYRLQKNGSEEVSKEDCIKISKLNGKYKHLLQNPDFQKSLAFPVFGEVELSYRIKRLCRLREPFSLKIYAGYTNYHSRIGLPGDYAEKLLKAQEKNHAKIEAFANRKEAAAGEEK